MASLTSRLHLPPHARTPRHSLPTWLPQTYHCAARRALPPGHASTRAASSRPNLQTRGASSFPAAWEEVDTGTATARDNPRKWNPSLGAHVRSPHRVHDQDDSARSWATRTKTRRKHLLLPDRPCKHDPGERDLSDTYRLLRRPDHDIATRHLRQLPARRAMATNPERREAGRSSTRIWISMLA